MKDQLLAILVAICACSFSFGAEGASDSERIYNPICGIDEEKYTEASPFLGRPIGVVFEANKGIGDFKKKNARFLEKTLQERACFYVGTALRHHLFVNGSIGADGSLDKIEERWAISSKNLAIAEPRNIPLLQPHHWLVLIPDLRKVVSIDLEAKIIRCEPPQTPPR